MLSYSAFDQTIRVEFRAFPALLWLGAGFEVRVGDRVFHPKLGRLALFSQPFTEFEIYHYEKRIPGMVRGVGPWWFLFRKRYSLVVGLSELARDTQTMRGWPLSALMTLLFYMVVVLTILGGFCAVTLARMWLGHAP